MMQDRLGLNLNKKDRFALAEKFCYFGYAPAKSGVGISTPFLNRGISLYLVMVDCLGRSIGSAVSLFNGSANPLWSATISLAPDVGGITKLNRGTAMKTLWCYVVGACQRFLSFPNDLGVVATPLGVQS